MNLFFYVPFFSLFRYIYFVLFQKGFLGLPIPSFSTFCDRVVLIVGSADSSACNPSIVPFDLPSVSCYLHALVTYCRYVDNDSYSCLIASIIERIHRDIIGSDIHYE